ncbi:Dipeptidase 1 [Geodia barretti]|uniref:Dipeptidase n=1 Tax=Geodia barretti TaxID=519541 RepID=A0AA35RNA6_GEOBA|nr:Dipeptidase 1 [Geodia barretti]
MLRLLRRSRNSMSDEESDALDASQLLGSSDTAADESPSAATIDSRRESRRSHFVFLGIILAAAVLVLVVGLSVGLSSVGGGRSSDPMTRAEDLLAEYPVIDGHNDLAYELRANFKNQLGDIDLLKNTSGQYGVAWQTDIPRLRAGHVGGQFWSAYMGCGEPHREDATRTFLDQMDVIKRFVQNYTSTFLWATTSKDMELAVPANKIASLIGVEGGHAISSSLGTLRQLYELGARYMTLTHTCNTPWAHSSTDTTSNGLTDFGRRVVLEMNRLGMLVDISHVNNYTMSDVLATSKAPVIFSHSSAYALCNNSRNVPDNILMKMPANGGVVMVNFYPGFINCSSTASLEQVADHIDHICSVAGVDHIGIGADYDGIDRVPYGLEDVSKYPALFAELLRRGYSDSDVAKVARLNIIRVFQEAEEFVGKVIGTQMMKTAKVEVTRMVLHPHVLKVSSIRHTDGRSLYIPPAFSQYVKRRKKYLCHDPESSCRVGDLVMIRSCQPLNKRKHFTVAEILDLSPAHRAEIEREQGRLGELEGTPGTTEGSSS